MTRQAGILPASALGKLEAMPAGTGWEAYLPVPSCRAEAF